MGLTVLALYPTKFLTQADQRLRRWRRMHATFQLMIVVRAPSPADIQVNLLFFSDQGPSLTPLIRGWDATSPDQEFKSTPNNFQLSFRGDLFKEERTGHQWS